MLLLMPCALVCEAQKSRWARRNNPNYDDKKLTYGFLIGLHTSAYQIKYSDSMVVTPKFDTLHSVNPSWSSGFSLGFIVNYRLTDFLDIRLTPKVAFYEHRLTYLFTDDTPRKEELVETTMVEFPVLLKYKSERRGNIRMYMIGGVKPAIEASGKNEEDESGNLGIRGSNLSLEAGFGFDLYYPLFKFSPEIRFSRGITNLLGDRTNAYGTPLQRINTNTITVYLLFQ
ncbi:MAG TPA: porin family protein [Ohtaekwangia sp.]|nr:porin family protein [Ohtaekwangia sp.]